MPTSNNTPQASVVRAIESRVERILADHKRLYDHNKALTAQRDELLKSRRELQEKMAKMEKELAIAQLSASLSGSTKTNTRAKAYINRLMREVDSCITLLSSPGGQL